jgi:hypothetical protein
MVDKAPISQRFLSEQMCVRLLNQTRSVDLLREGLAYAHVYRERAWRVVSGFRSRPNALTRGPSTGSSTVRYLYAEPVAPFGSRGLVCIARGGSDFQVLSMSSGVRPKGICAILSEAL